MAQERLKKQVTYNLSPMLNRILPITLLCTALLAQDPAPNRILRPTDGATLTGKIEGIAKVVKAGQLFLDGVPLPTNEIFPGVLTFGLTSTTGQHVLELRFEGGSQKIDFYSGKAEATGKTFRFHPPSATCETCHAVKAGIWSFKTDPLEATCAGCHNLKEFAKSHTHNTGQLAECGMCHNPHGSTEAFHLKYPRNVACKQCHG